MSQLETKSEESGPQAPPLAASMSRVLADPLSALRASMEALISDVGREAPHGAQLEGALDQITRLARDVQSLVELAQPCELFPLSCSLDELARSALRNLPALERARVHYARPTASARLYVDGPTLSASIASLLAGALEDTTRDVLLHTSQSETSSLFAFVYAAATPQRGDLASSAPDEAARDVRSAVARRDVARMGGQITQHTNEHGATCLRVELPSRTPLGEEGGAA